MPRKQATRKKDAARPAKRSARRAPAAGGASSGLTAADVMARDVVTVHPATPVAEVSALFKLHNIKGAPVVERNGELVGIITEDDLYFGQLGISDEERELMTRPGRGGPRRAKVTRRVAEIMTQNPIAAGEATPVEELCRLMSRLKIHRIPIVSEDGVVGIVSTIDICRILAEGKARLVRS